MATLETSATDRQADRMTKPLIGARATALPKKMGKIFRRPGSPNNLELDPFLGTVRHFKFLSSHFGVLCVIFMGKKF